MNAKLLATVSVVALTLGACTANQPKSVVDTPEIRYQTGKVERAVSLVPSWYKKMPEKKGSIFTVGSATAPDLQLQSILQHSTVRLFLQIVSTVS